ncbi:MAG: RlmE family RNA methyltransferase [Alphaproteobacteria bacterium]|nr:RlmE family RNA methyltransferase [Alphaproteobacteria bacterium]
MGTKSPRGGRRAGQGGGRGGGGSKADSAPTFTGRKLAERVKTAKGRTISSKLWLERQLNDPYVAEAKRRGYRSRAAFKLGQLDDKFGFLKPGARVVDLGAAPGGWTQVAVERLKGRGTVVGIDLLPIEPIPGAVLLLGDMREPAQQAKVTAALGGPADVVMSDMAASSTGHGPTDHLRIVALCEDAFAFAEEVLAPGGAFVCKVLKGGTEAGLLAALKRAFASVKHAKPPASRSESAETYVVAQGYRRPAAPPAA